MPRNPSEFVHFIARHYHLLAAMCQERSGFQTDEELAAFVRSHVHVEGNPARLITEMKRLGVLTQSTGEWAPPPFLVRFMDQLRERHVLATPSVVRAWVEKLQGVAADLERLLKSPSVTEHAADEEALRSLLHEIGDTLHVVSTTVSDNIERIGQEVALYRATEDAPKMRLRLRRLVDLFENYLTPIMRILDSSGPFRAVTQQIIMQCARMARRDDLASPALADDARHLRQQVTWLRRTVLRQADEANAELAPLCVAAARESGVARGVNRALEAVRQGQWLILDLQRQLPVVGDQDSALAGDDAIRAFMQDAFTLREEPPPRLVPEEPGEIPIPLTAEVLQARLAAEEHLEDLLAWVIDECDDFGGPDICVDLLHGLLEIERSRLSAGDTRREYAFSGLVVETRPWTWSKQSES